MLAYVVLNYDMRMADEGKVPDEFWLGENVFPDPGAHMLIRKRETVE